MAPCNNDFEDCKERHYSLRICPDCGDDLGYPNVREAQKGKDALLDRYKTVNSVGKQEKLKEFEEEILQQSNTIISIHYEFLLAHLTSKNSFYTNYYRLVESGARAIASREDQQRRREADNLVFTGYERDICFCTLSLDHTGAWGWGPWHIVLRLGNIEDRISFTQHNTYRNHLWFDSEVHDDGSDKKVERPGYRAVWATRAILAVAKHARDINSETKREDFPTILLNSQGDRKSDEFIEGHIHGPLTLRAFATVRSPTPDEAKRLVQGGEPRLALHIEDIAAKLSVLQNQGITIALERGDHRRP